MNLRHMEIFRTIYHAKSVSGAARILGISQPSVSRMLHYLEYRLGYKLFRLRKGRIVPTHEAEHMINEIDGVFEAVGRVDRIANDLREGTGGRISVVAVSSLAVGILPAVLRQVAERHPKIPISLNAQNLSDQISTVSSAEADIGIATNVQPSPGLERRLLGKAYFVAVLHKDHACAGKRLISLADFCQWPSIISPLESPLGNVIHLEFRKRGLKPYTAVTTKSPILSAGLIESFEGLGLLDCLTARLMTNDSLLLKPLDQSITFPIHAFWRTNSPLSHAHLEILDLVEKQLHSLKGSMPGSGSAAATAQSKARRTGNGRRSG